MTDIPPLPEGFTLDAPAAAQPSQIPPLPPGFTLDPINPLKAAFASGAKPNIDQVRAAGGLRERTAADDAQLAGQFLSGVPILGGFVDQAGAALSAAAQPVTGVGAEGQSFGERYAENVKNAKADREAFEKAHPVASTAAQLAGGTAAMLPLGATAIGARALGLEGGNVAGRVAASMATNAGIGAADNTVRGGSPITGALLGGIGGGAGSVAGSSLERAARPFIQSPARQAMVNVLRNEGVNPTAGQASGSRALRYSEGALGEAPLSGGRAAEMMERQAEAFTRAALRRAGTNADRATPDVMFDTSRRIGGEFDRLSSNNNMRLDPVFGRDIGRILNEYDRVLPSQQREIIGNYVDDILGFGRTLPGEVYQEARSRLSRQSHSIRQTDPAFSGALAGIRDALDNAMGRSIRPDDRAAWNMARRQWAAYRTIEKAASGAGENAALGLVSPAQLRNAVAVRNRGAYVRGQGDLAELARAGTAVLSPLPNSGTAQRNAAYHFATTLAGAGIGAGTGEASGSGWQAGALAGALAPGLAGRALLSRPAQAYLTNGFVNPAAAAALRGLGVAAAPSLFRQQGVASARLPYQNDGR